MTMDKQTQARPADQQQVRRRIIKGLAGLPAVMTLSNGAAAATASALECVLDPNKYQPNVTLNTPGGNPTMSCVPNANEVPYLTGQGLYQQSDLDAVRRLNEQPGPGQNEYCVIYVDQNGVETGSFQAADGGTAITASCYASIITSA